MKKTIALLSAAVIAAVFLLFHNDIRGALKAGGYVAYGAAEAQALAYRKCGSCHNTEKILKYCMRCGPPFIVVVHNMRTLVEYENAGGKKFEGYTDAEAVAITEVWNALVGNWEDAWRREDIVKLLEGDKALIKLLDTRVKDRPIEAALAGKLAPGAYKEDMPDKDAAPAGTAPPVARPEAGGKEIKDKVRK